MNTRARCLAACGALLLAMLAVPAVAGGPAAASPSPLDGPTQVIAANAAVTNLPTESFWAGAQSPPYLCCWTADGEFATFSFTVGGGPTQLTLRYSAANGAATRKTELDGAVWQPNQVFPTTLGWSTWAVLSHTVDLSAGTHTLRLSFDANAGSNNPINLDNLQITARPAVATGVAVALGYADSAAGLDPWNGSPATTFIGGPPECCSTHGPDLGSPVYDAGAIEITNTRAAPLTVNAATVDFAGVSNPSHFDLWGGGTAATLPQVLAPGAHLVLTMTNGFNFDTSDLFGEACHPNSGIVPIVHVTVDGSVTDYEDDHQILNGHGTDLAACPAAVSEKTAFTPVRAGAQDPTPPVDVVAPSVAGSAVRGRVLSGVDGGWHGSPVPTQAVQWQACDAAGLGCVAIPGAAGATYRPTASDVGHTLRMAVTAANASGSATRASAPTAVVVDGPAVAQLGNTDTGFTSRFVDHTAVLESTFTATEPGTTTSFEFYARGAGADQGFTPRIYASVNGSRGALLASGTRVSVPATASGTWWVSSLPGLALATGLSYDFVLEADGQTQGTYVGGGFDEVPAFFVDYTPGGSGFHPVSPTRILDSRDGTGLGGTISKWGPGETRTLDVTDTYGSGVPATGVTAVVLNVTVTGTTSPGYLTVFPSDPSPRPTASNLNWVAGETAPDLVTVKAGADGRVRIYNFAGSTDVIADVVGWFDDGTGIADRYTPLAPHRIVDSRDGTGTGGSLAPWAAGQTRVVDVTDTYGSGVPASGVSAVMLNVTVTDTTGDGYLTVFPSDAPQRPTASNLNWVAGMTRPNLVSVKVGADGTVKIFNSAGSTHVVVDVVGYYSASGSAFHPLAPTRLLDSRSPAYTPTGPWQPGQTRTLDVTDTHQSGVPAGAVTAVVLSVTVTDTTGTGFLTVFPSSTTRPTASNLNWTPGVTRPNLVVALVGAAGTIDLFNSAGSTDVIVDVVGYYG